MPQGGLEQAAAAANVDLNSVYLMIGALIIMNIGAIGTGLIFFIKVAWAASKYDSRIIKLEADMNAAHAKIRDLEVKRGKR